MKIGYPCINLTLPCKGDRTFRLRSYSEEHLIATVRNNLDCLVDILRFNAEHELLFFRITSDLVPFASHPVCAFDWQGYFGDNLGRIGVYIRNNRMRISMHPDQFTLINSVDPGVFERSVKELLYHAQVLDSMGLDTTARIQIHVGGVYGDKSESIRRFAARFKDLPDGAKRRLVVENDDRLYCVQDCLRVHEETGIPVLFDVFHHFLNNEGETAREAFEAAGATWAKGDGLPMVDYSCRRRGALGGGHARSIDVEDFRRFLKETEPHDFDIMLEIKDKESSALKAVEICRNDRRFSRVVDEVWAPPSPS
jgi:UV DNA damage endonuclease